jgi:hypothetical protein
MDTGDEGDAVLLRAGSSVGSWVRNALRVMKLVMSRRSVVWFRRVGPDPFVGFSLGPFPLGGISVECPFRDADPPAGMVIAARSIPSDNTEPAGGCRTMEGLLDYGEKGHDSIEVREIDGLFP